jgi:hypothetical protein
MIKFEFLVRRDGVCPNWCLHKERKKIIREEKLPWKSLNEISGFQEKEDLADPSRLHLKFSAGVTLVLVNCSMLCVCGGLGILHVQLVASLH